MGIGAQELIIVLVIILLLFGAKKLPELAGSLGKSVKEFRKATDEAEAEAEARAESTTRGDAAADRDS